MTDSKMPRIAQYTAPIEKLTESTRGTAAFEQAGRRLGPLYNEAATFEKQQGADTAQEIKDQEWPFDIAKLLAAQNAGSRISWHGKGIGEDTSAIGGSYIGLPDNSGDPANQISRGAGALGSALSDGGYAMSTSTGDGELVGYISNNQKVEDLYNKGLDTWVSQGAASEYAVGQQGTIGDFSPRTDVPDTNSSTGYFSQLTDLNSAATGNPVPDTGGM